MEATLESGERTNRNTALIGTIVFHALILLFLIYYIIITPIPPFPPPPKTVELALDFGNGINGSGSAEANKMGNNQANDNNANQNTSKPVPQSNAVVTNNAEVNPSMNSAKKPTHTDKVDTVSKPQQQISTELASVENKFKHSKGQPGGNGDANQNGNAGDPNGRNPGVGNGTGNGPEYFLNGRSLLSHPIPVNVSKDQGKVVVEITVDPDGNVIKAIPGAKGSTTSSPYLCQKAKEAALATKFSKSKDPNTPQQEGTMTIVFTIQ